jgi:hypothetical protein
VSSTRCGNRGSERLEAAAARAIEIGALRYASLRSILDHKLDRQRPADGIVPGKAV